METEPYITLDEVCEYLGVKKQWVYDAQKRGFPTRRLSGRLLRSKISWIEQWLDKQEKKAS